MKSVLISIQPQYIENICAVVGEENGKPVYKKKIEVRKTVPKLKTPFKCYMYMTKDCKKHYYIDEYGDRQVELIPQKIIGEFVCDRIDEYKFFDNLVNFNSMGLPLGFRSSYLIFQDDYEAMCLTYEEVKAYAKGKNLYGWHISDLKIYDTPKELGEFRKCAYPKQKCLDEKCEHWGYCGCGNVVARPPQSWCYVDEVKV